jgi:hypothetical protein
MTDNKMVQPGTKRHEEGKKAGNKSNKKLCEESPTFSSLYII